MSRRRAEVLRGTLDLIRELLPLVLMVSSAVFAQAHQSRDAQQAMERSRRENEKPNDIVRLIGVLPRI